MKALKKGYSQRAPERKIGADHKNSNTLRHNQVIRLQR